MLTNPIIALQAGRLTVSPIPWDDNLSLVCVVHLGVAPAVAEVYAIDRAGTARSIGRSEPIGKDDSAGARAYHDGTVRLFVAEADPTAGSSGTTTKVRFYDFPGAVPPAPPETGGGADTLVREVLKVVRGALGAIP